MKYVPSLLERLHGWLLALWALLLASPAVDRLCLSLPST